MNKDIVRGISIKLDRLDRKHKYVVKMSELAGKQEALISLMQDIMYRRQKTGRKTIDIDTVRKMIMAKLDNNSKEVRELMNSHKGYDKIIHIEESEKWQELK